MIMTKTILYGAFILATNQGFPQLKSFRYENSQLVQINEIQHEYYTF